MFSPKNILITGANRGLGLELVKQFLNLKKPPKTLLATCRNPLEAKDLSEIASQHSNVKILQLDVEDESSIADIAKQVESHIEAEGLNLLINNAGVNIRLGLDTVTNDAMIKSYRIHVLGPLNLVQALLPHLKQAAKSSPDTGLNCTKSAIINISSILASITESTGGLYPYRTTKAALNMLTKNMNIDLKQDGILCCCLHPGWVQTDMGGPNAAVVKETSVAGLINVMSQMNEKSPIFQDYTGKVIDW